MRIFKFIIAFSLACLFIDNVQTIDCISCVGYGDNCSGISETGCDYCTKQVIPLNTTATAQLQQLASTVVEEDDTIPFLHDSRALQESKPLSPVVDSLVYTIMIKKTCTVDKSFHSGCQQEKYQNNTYTLVCNCDNADYCNNALPSVGTLSVFILAILGLSSTLL